MAKPHNKLPGCSGHVHISLRDKSGRNIFAAESERSDARFDDAKFISPECEHFIAGILAGLADVMPCLVPTVNGYKRLVENFWAPTTASWAYENRVASIRVLSPPGVGKSSTRIEVVREKRRRALTQLASARRRHEPIPDHCCDHRPRSAWHPAQAASRHAAGHFGWCVPACPELSSPGQPSKRLPADLREATQNMVAKDSYARKIFGDAFVDHFAGTRVRPRSGQG